VSQLKTDPRIRLALENFKTDYPTLYRKFFHRAKFVGKGEDGSKIYAIEKEPGLKIISSPSIDGVTNHYTQEAKNILRRMIDKHGLDKENIDLWVEKFSSITADDPILRFEFIT